MLSPRLLALLGVASVAAVGEPHLRSLAEGRVAEDQDLEFHRARYNQGPDGTFELAKDIAALANHLGGLIILGIAEDDQGRAAELTPVKLSDSEKGRIRQVIADRIHPMVTGADVRVFPSATDEERGYYVIVVPRSGQSPHAVRRSDPHPLWFCYPLRHGTTTHYLTEAEIAARYRDRFALARGQVNRLDRLHVQGHRNEIPDGLTVAVALVPTLGGNRSLTEEPKISDFLAAWSSPLLALDAGGGWNSYRVARRRLRSEGKDAILELHTDGSGWASYRVSGYHLQDDELGIMLADLETSVVELLALLGSYATWSGAAGDCAINVWLYGRVLWRRVRLKRGGFQDDVIWRHAWPQEPAETTAPVDQLADRSQVGVVAYPLVRDLEQEMGVPEPVSL